MPARKSAGKPQTPEKISLWATIVSVLAAMFGVQTEENRQRDFQQGKPTLFIAIGIGFIILFVLSLIAIVQWVLP